MSRRQETRHRNRRSRHRGPPPRASPPAARSGGDALRRTRPGRRSRRTPPEHRRPPPPHPCPRAGAGGQPLGRDRPFVCPALALLRRRAASRVSRRLHGAEPCGRLPAVPGSPARGFRGAWRNGSARRGRSRRPRQARRRTRPDRRVDRPRRLVGAVSASPGHLPRHTAEAPVRRSVFGHRLHGAGRRDICRVAGAR